MRNTKYEIRNTQYPQALNSMGLLAVFLLPTYLIRFSVFGVPTNVLDVLIGVFLMASFPLAIQKIQLSPKIILILTLVLTGVLTSAARGGFSAGELGIIKSWFVLPILFAVFYFSLFQKQKDRQTILWAYIFSAFAVSVIALGYFFAGDTTYDGRLRAFYESPNQLAMYMAPALALLWFLLKGINNKKYWLLVTGYWLLLGTCLYLTLSYGAWIAIIISIVIGEYLLSAQKRAWVKIFAVCAGLIIILAATQFKNEKLHDLATLDSRSSLASREMIWRAAWDIGKDNWLLGIGPGNFQEKYLEYQKFYPPYLEWAVPQPHNLYLAFWLQTGLLGFVGFCILLYAAVVIPAKAGIQNIYKRKKTATLLDIAALCALLTILLHGLIDTPYWRNDLSVVFWVLVLFMYNRDC